MLKEREVHKKQVEDIVLQREKEAAYGEMVEATRRGPWLRREIGEDHLLQVESKETKSFEDTNSVSNASNALMLVTW